jgi:cation transport ATPase
MGVSGTDVAVETADVALASDDLRALLDLRELGRRVIRVIRVIRQNYGMSIAANTAGLAVSAGGALSPRWPPGRFPPGSAKRTAGGHVPHLLTARARLPL